MLKPIILWGATGHAKVLREFMAEIGYKLVAIFDNSPVVVAPFPDVPLWHSRDGFEAWQAQWRAEHVDVAVSSLVAIGGSRGRDRVAIQRFLEARGCAPIIALHPSAFVAADAKIGRGSQILARAVVCVEARMGEACIVNTAASVDHECVLGDGVHIAPGATLAGGVVVGDHSLIGPGAVVLPHITIGRDAVVGAGAVVTRNVPDGVVVYGNPARVRRALGEGG